MSAWTAGRAGRAAAHRAKLARAARSRAPGSLDATSARPPWGAGRAWPVALAAVFAVALAWRLAYLHRLRATPLGGSLTEDAHFYWDWAGFLLRHGFLGSHPFFLAPLYPYVLAPLRMLLGDSVQHALAVQALWGAGAVAMLADAARRITRPSVGLAVGALAAFYESAVFFDGLVLAESLLFFLESLLLWWIAARGASVSRAWVAAATGALIGVIAEGRATSTLLLLPAALCIVQIARGGAPRAANATRGEVPDAARIGARRGRALPGLAALAAGFLTVTTPVAIRNFAVGHEWIPFTYNLGFNLYAGYNPEANGAFTSITGTHRASAPTEELTEAGAQVDGREYLRKVDGVDLSPAASSAYWARKALRWMRAHPIQALQLSGRKLLMIWNRDEYAQIENIREYRSVAGPLGLPFVGEFLGVGALAIAGVVLGLRRAGGAAAVAARFATAYLVVMTLSIVPFFVTDRYRFHLVPAALVLAGLALERFVDAVRSREPRPLGQSALALAAGLVVVNLPAPHMSANKYAWGLATDLGQRWAEQGRYDLAVQQYERAIALERQGGLARLPGSTAATERSDLYYDYANALVHAGRDSDAVAAYERAVAEAPDRAQAVRALADWYAHRGRTAQAESLYALLPTKVGGYGLAAAGRGWMAARAGRFGAAESLFADAVRHDPTLADAWGGLIRLEVQRGALHDARGTLERARLAGLSGPPLTAHEALLAALEGRPAEAEQLLTQVPAAALNTDQTLADVVQVTRSILARGR